jgi:uncharacterized membrane protein
MARHFLRRNRARAGSSQQQPGDFRNPDLADIVERNIGTILEMRQEFENARSTQERVADAVTAFAGSMAFVYLHMAWFGAWIVVNLGWLGLHPFDPYPFGLLTMIVSLEAIFLSTFVLVSQNRMSMTADQRADLDLQIDLLSEHEVTRLLVLVDAIADHLGVTAGNDPEDDELKSHTSPEVLIKEIQNRAEDGRQQRARGATSGDHPHESAPGEHSENRPERPAP